ncbi:MAG: AsmA family protein, partial [Gammaproteobacteria bacterium]|nr:AsmA family protein [Gammaproteobacteria bacterium]
VEDAALGNEEGFEAKQFAAIKQLDIKINVLPLLKKEVEINIIRLHGLNVSLEVAENKSNNWSGLSQSGEAGDAEKASQPDVQEKASADAAQQKSEPQQTVDDVSPLQSSLQSLRVEGFEFVDAVIRYDDRSSKTKATVSELNLTTSAIAFDEPVEIKFSAHVENNQPLIDTRLQLNTKLTFNQELTTFNLSDFVFTILASANEFIVQQEQIEIKSTIDVSMDEERISLKQLQLSALGTTTLADISVTQFLQTPVVQAGVEIQSFNARDLAKRIAVELPAMAKADALHRIAIKTKIKLHGEKLQANDFNLTLDDSTLSGWIHVLDLGKQQLRYDLAFDQLNINDYLPPEVKPVGANKAAVSNAAVNKGATVSAEAAPVEKASTGDEEIKLPVEMMRKLDIEGDFRIASLIAKDYQIKQFLMSSKAKQGVINIKPLSMQVLQGQVNTAIKLNVQKSVPAYAINLKVNQVQLGPIANPYLVGVMGDKPLTMEGAVNVATDIKTAGKSINQLKKASKGQIVLDMKKTRVDGFDPEFYMRSSIANYLNDKGLGLSETIMGSYTPRDVTVFDKIHSTVNLANGKARTDDFLMDSKRVQVTAKGFADIMQNTLDVTSSVKLPRGKTTVERLLSEPLYVRVHGPFDALAYELDKNRLKKSTSDIIKKEAKVKAKKELKKETDKLQQKLQDKLKDKFRGLF